jgi:hypothetical protein
MARTSTLAVALGALILLAGCSTTTHFHNRLHPEYGQTDFDRDWYECQRENDNMAMSCFRTRGWYPD